MRRCDPCSPGAPRPGHTRAHTTAILLLTLAAILAGCSTAGDGSGDADGGGGGETLTVRSPERVATIDALLDRVPGDTTSISVVDIAAARRALGLPATADPTDDSGKVSSPRYRLSEFAAPVLEGLADEVPSKRAAQAVDFGRVTAAVSLGTFERNEMVMVLTPQPRRAIADALTRNPRQPVKTVAANILLATGQESSEARARALGSLDYIALGEGFVAVTDTLARARAVLTDSGPARGFAVARRYLDIAQRASRLIAIWSSARTRVRVNCPSANSKPNSTIRCTGTRRDGSRQYGYAVAVTFDASRLAEIGSVAVTSSDDKTGTIMDYR